MAPAVASPSMRKFEADPPAMRPGMAFDTRSRGLFSPATVVLLLVIGTAAFIALALTTAWPDAVAELLSATAGLTLALVLGEELLYRRARINELRDLEGSRIKLAALVLDVCVAVLDNMQLPTAYRVHWNQFNTRLHQRQLVNGEWIIDASAAFWNRLRAVELSIAEKHEDWIDDDITDEDIADAGLRSRDSLVKSADLITYLFDDARLDVAVWLGRSQPSPDFAHAIQELFRTRSSWDSLREFRSPAMYLSASKDTLTALSLVGATLAELPPTLAPSAPVPDVRPTFGD